MAMPREELLRRRAEVEEEEQAKAEEAKRIGRPSVRHRGTIDTLKRALRLGLSMDNAACCAGVSARSVRRWMEEDDELHAEIHQARADAIAGVAGKLLGQIRRDYFPAIKFWLERRAPEFTQQATAVEINVEAGKVQVGPKLPDNLADYLEGVAKEERQREQGQRVTVEDDEQPEQAPLALPPPSDGDSKEKP